MLTLIFLLFSPWTTVFPILHLTMFPIAWTMGYLVNKRWEEIKNLNACLSLSEHILLQVPQVIWRHKMSYSDKHWTPQSLGKSKQESYTSVMESPFYMPEILWGHCHMANDFNHKVLCLSFSVIIASDIALSCTRLENPHHHMAPSWAETQ